MPLPPPDDTIAAIATAPGVGAVGIVRVAGPEAYKVADALFLPSSGQPARDLKAGRVTYGRVMDGSVVVDEALLLSFRAPHSYTAQDVVEIQTHGGPAVLRKVLDLCVQQGARLAGPGEFTLRAYLNGRMDLVQAESVLGMVNAQSDSARRSAALGLTKALSDQLELIQTDITKVYGNIQAMFDYPDEGVPEAEFGEPLARALDRIDALLRTAAAGRIARQGARLALVGKPNAGKSSLLNALLGFERSIVSELPGTTRDYLEAPLSLDGVPVTAIDTAGIRHTEDAVEASGVAQAKQIAANADLSLFLLDVSQPVTSEDRAMLEGLAPERTLVVASKTDLPKVWDDVDATLYPVSTRTGAGIDALTAAIKDKLVGAAGASELWIGNERHTAALERTKTLLERARNAPDDLAALDLEDALRSLAAITGRGDIAEETLAHIFANFCVGK